MNKFKDFLYDKNDILIAVLILAFAALIIGWRLNVILDYPKQLLSDNGTAVSEPSDSNTDAKPNADAPTDDNTTGGDQSGENGSSPSEPVKNALWENGVLTKDVEVNMEGTTASAAVQCLVDAGIFTDYKEYQTLCESAGLDHEKVRGGAMAFKKGSTKAEIVKAVNWS